jgi:hypothetical protein
LTEPTRNDPVNLPRPQSIVPTAARDQTRIARARWAEVVLKMRTRSKNSRLDPAAFKITDRFF